MKFNNLRVLVAFLILLLSSGAFVGCGNLEVDALESRVDDFIITRALLTCRNYIAQYTGGRRCEFDAGNSTYRCKGPYRSGGSSGTYVSLKDFVDEAVYAGLVRSTEATRTNSHRESHGFRWDYAPDKRVLSRTHTDPPFYLSGGTTKTHREVYTAWDFATRYTAGTISYDITAAACVGGAIHRVYTDERNANGFREVRTTKDYTVGTGPSCASLGVETIVEQYDDNGNVVFVENVTSGSIRAVRIESTAEVCY